MKQHGYVASLVQQVFFPQQQLKLVSYLLPFLSGVLLIPAFPPLEQGYLAWVALIPLLWFCLKTSLRQALLGGFIYGLPLNLYLNFYLSGILFAHLSPVLTLLTMVLLVFIISCFNALFAMAAAYIRRLGTGAGLVLALPSLWIIIEYARSVGFLGYTVGYLGYTQWNYPEVLNLASVYGYWALPWVMLAFQVIMVLLGEKKLTGQSLLLAISIPGVVAALGIIIPPFFPVEDDGSSVPVALIQGYSSQEEILSEERDTILQRYLELTRLAAENEPEVELVIWPETVVDLKLDNSIKHKPEMEGLAQELDIGILYGARSKTEGNRYNSILLLSSTQETSSIYHKRRLVPFVEYFPMKELLNELVELELELGGYTPGEEIVLFEYAGIPMGGVVCFESYFGDYTRLFAQQGGRHLYVLTNDAWFGETIGLEQHAQVGAIRAAEMGIGFTQVANSGITISFDYRGREQFRSGKGTREILYTELDPSGRQTIYRYAGDYFPAFWLTYLAGYIVVAKIKKRSALVKSFSAAFFS